MGNWTIDTLLLWLSGSMGDWKTEVLLLWLAGRMGNWTIDALIHCRPIILIVWFTWFSDTMIGLILWFSDFPDSLICWFADPPDPPDPLIHWFIWFADSLVCWFSDSSDSLIYLLSGNQLSENQLSSYSGSLLLWSPDIQNFIQPAILHAAYQLFQTYRKPGVLSIRIIRHSASVFQL